MNNDSFDPVIRFCLCSDVHIHEKGDVSTKRLRDFIAYCKSYAGGEKYGRIDAFCFVGDSVNDGRREQFEIFRDIVGEAIGSESEILCVLARHHDNWEQGRDGEKTGLLHYRELFGRDTDFHTVINGFHFIGTSTCDIKIIYYTEQQKEWLDREIAKAVAESPNKPVFVLQHEPPTGTIFGSMYCDRWGMDYFNDVFDKYPSVVHFSGHTHYPMNDPRTVLQDKYTAVGLGTLRYAELTVKKQRSVFPDGKDLIAQGLIVEANEAGDLNLIGVDALSGSVLFEYYLPCPAVEGNLTRTYAALESASKAPAFPDNAKLEISSGSDELELTFPAAKGSNDDPVFAYFARQKDESGAVLDENFFVPPYWRKNDISTFTIKLKKADKAKQVELSAENVFEKASSPLIKEL